MLRIAPYAASPTTVLPDCGILVSIDWELGRTDRWHARPRVADTHPMAKRAVKSLHRTGRVSRKKASAVAKRLRAELDSGEIKPVSGAKVTRKTTASGRSSISFHVVSAKSSKTRKTKRARKAARKAAR